MSKSIDLTNKKINFLTALYKTDRRDSAGGNYWMCQCDCGEKKEISANAIMRESTASCGCFRKNIKKTHGKSGSRLYNIWTGFRNRCNNPKGKSYTYYGGKGIKVCEDWNIFDKFFEWSINNGYNESLTIDRIDVNGDYSPENCRWVTIKEQANNKSSNHILTYKNISKNIAQWSEEFKTSRDKTKRNFNTLVKIWEENNNKKIDE